MKIIKILWHCCLKEDAKEKAALLGYHVAPSVFRAWMCTHNHFHTLSSSWQVIHTFASSSQSLSCEKILQQHIQLYFFIPSSKGFHQALKQVRILSLREHWQRPPSVRQTFPNPHTMGRIYCWEKALVGISNSAGQTGGNRLTASEALRALILNYLVIPINISSAQWKTDLAADMQREKAIYLRVSLKHLNPISGKRIVINKS